MTLGPQRRPNSPAMLQEQSQDGWKDVMRGTRSEVYQVYFGGKSKYNTLTHAISKTGGKYRIVDPDTGKQIDPDEGREHSLENSKSNLGKKPDLRQDPSHFMPLNLILYGPPGTGKTYQTIYRSVEIIDGQVPSGEFSKVKERYDELLEKGQIGFVTFHQSYSYEDFVEGIRPVLSDDSSEAARYDCRPGLFRMMCEQAASIEKRTAFYDFDPSVIKFYKMSLGDTLSGDEDIYEYCVENNVVSLGWGRDVDFSDCSSKLDIREKYTEKYPDESPFGVDAVLRFKNWMKRNDIVIVSRGNHQIRAIGKVTGDYTFNLETPIRHNQFRDVEWLYKDAIIPVNQILKEKVLSQQTIYQFYDKDLNIEGIKSLLSTSVGEEKNDMFSSLMRLIGVIYQKSWENSLLYWSAIKGSELSVN